MGDPFLKFGVDLAYGCSVSLALADLQNYCSQGSGIQGLPIFQNANFIQKYGKFANANIYFK